mmetsp:Transcript_10109/g.8905  ORF Transcript_10109/g.8905 Transcript_10109/m.8905 type:complete len:112 (-) Transcript_10109:458-793(-)
MHIIIRHGCQSVYKLLMGIFLKTHRTCNELLGKYEHEEEAHNYRKDSSDLIVEEEPSKSLSQDFYDYMDVDGDIASTDTDEEDKEDTSLPTPKALTIEEAKIVRMNILKFM